MGNERIQVVEDEVLVAEMIRSCLQKLGYRVTGIAASGKEAVDSASQNRPDLVLMDIALEGPMDGVEAARQIRYRLNIPVIYLTAGADAATISRAKLAEPLGYILKPFRSEDLRGAIETALYQFDMVRKRTQESVRQAEERCHSIFENAGEGIYQSTPDGRFRVANPALARMLGYDSSEELISSVTDIEHQLYVESGCRKEFQRLLNEIGRIQGHESQLWRKDGTKVWISENSRAVFNPACELLYYEGFIEDITGRKLAEKERSRIEAQLGQAQEQLLQAQKMEAVGRLASGVAHDFNNLLSLIIGYVDFALERLDPSDPSVEELTEVKAAADSAVALTRQLLVFSRRHVMEQRAINLNDVVRDSERMLRRILGEDIDLVVELDPSLGTVKGAPEQIEQVVMNLAINARDAMPRGGTLTMRSAHAVLDEQDAFLHAEISPGNYEVLSVTDTGTGMDREIQSHIFEPFFTTKGVGEGTGLGLSTVYGIVKQSGGWISVDSSPGRGATFKIYFPRIEEAATNEAEPTASPARLNGSETILVVEDSEQILLLIRKTLEARGYCILTAGDGVKALDIAAHHNGPIHLLLTDIVMPYMYGSDVATRVLKLHPDTRVLYMSGYTSDPRIHADMMQAGAAFIQKPFRAESIAIKIREILDSSDE